jgi:hypothetical protein
MSYPSAVRGISFDLVGPWTYFQLPHSSPGGDAREACFFLEVGAASSSVSCRSTSPAGRFNMVMTSK